MSAAIPITALDLLKNKGQPSRKRKCDESNDEISSTSSSSPPLPLLLLPNKAGTNHAPQHQHQQQQQNQNDLPKWLVLNKSNGNGIIELSGEAGAGKSQLCLSLCVSCILSSIPTPSSSLGSFSKEQQQQQQQGLLNHSVDHVGNHANYGDYYYHAMYITLGGEGNQSSQTAQRLYQMIEKRKEQHKNINSTTTNTKEIMKRIHND